MNLTFFNEYFAKSPVTFIVSLLALITSVAGLLNQKLFFKFILHPYSVVGNKEVYRIFTADLTNADLMHLLLNEFMLYVFCSDLEETLRKTSSSGSLQFLTIYLSSLLFASVIIVLRHFKDFNYSTTGTSGSIMGCMFAFMILAPQYVVLRLSHTGGIRNIYGGLIYILLLIAYQRKKGGEVINQEFHFYGAIGGIIATLLLHPELLNRIRG